MGENGKIMIPWDVKFQDMESDQIIKASIRKQVSTYNMRNDLLSWFQIIIPFIFTLNQAF